MLRTEWNNHRWQSIHVADVVEAVLAALRYGGRGTFNLTDGTTPTVGQLARHCAAVAADFGMDGRRAAGRGRRPARERRSHPLRRPVHARARRMELVRAADASRRR